MNSLPLEIQIAIFEHLYQEDNLLSSALVCRAWRDVAWDMVMWRSCMIRLSSLLEALFGDENPWEISYRDFVSLPSDSNRFLALAAKVAWIELDGTLVDSVVKVMLEVARSAPGEILFPALHRLDCGSLEKHPQGDFAHTVFAGSPIRTIWIDGGHVEEATVASRKLLTSLLTAHPQVQNVTVHGGHPPKSVGIPEFWRLPNLRSLAYSGCVAYEEWTKFIQECPMLNVVRLVGDTRDPVPPNPPSISARSLRRLNLEYFTSFDLTIAILESIDARDLMELDVRAAPDRENTVAEHPSAERARSAFRVLAKRSQHLESMTVNASIKLGAEILAVFSSLRDLTITDRTPGCQLDDDGVELLCRSLRNLRKFHLTYYPHPEDREANITPKSFGSFSRHCQDLTDLGIPVTATNPEDFVGPILTELMPFRENLKSLTFEPLLAASDCTGDIISFLIVQCPHLTDLDMSSLEIVDLEVPNYILRNLAREMEHSYFMLNSTV
ncbi:hypothetical protein FRC00_010883, partial [Tulasnella sp. 408]